MSASTVRERFEYLAKLAPGWYDGDGGTYDRDQLQQLAPVLEAVECDARGPFIYPSLEGTVRVEWSFEGAAVSADFDLDTGDVWLQGVWLAVDKDLELTTPWCIDGAAATISAFLARFGSEP